MGPKKYSIFLFGLRITISTEKEGEEDSGGGKGEVEKDDIWKRGRWGRSASQSRNRMNAATKRTERKNEQSCFKSRFLILSGTGREMNCTGAWVGSAIAKGKRRGLIFNDFCMYYLLVAACAI
jgi:hypothetical protein